MTDYNKRLFGSFFRKNFHLARFYWLQKKLKSLSFHSVLELGCFDARSLDYFPEGINFTYTGLDQGWEKGLSSAMEKFNNDPKKKFYRIDTPSEILPFDKHDVTICLETLEHLPLQELEDFIEKLSLKTKKIALISVPNEIGIIFFFKHFSKFFGRMEPEPYTFTEAFWQILGKTNRVHRLQGSHKGFNYKDLITLIEKYFVIEKTESIPFTFLPVQFGFNIGIVARPK